MPFLGHLVSAAGIEPDPAKTERMKDYPTSTDVTEVRRFLELASYYRRLVPKFASIAAPINALTKKNVPFQWTKDCEASFEQMKVASLHQYWHIQGLALATVSFWRQMLALLVLELCGLGADEAVHPIVYASCSVDKHEKSMGSLSWRLLGSSGL